MAAYLGAWKRHVLQKLLQLYYILAWEVINPLIFKHYKYMAEREGFEPSMGF